MIEGMAVMEDITVVDMVDILVEAMAGIAVEVIMVGIAAIMEAITATTTTITSFGEQLGFCLEQL
ncbi:MAG: hypothetical protein ACYDBT_03115 [Desulfobulbaceae bacterium]